MARQNLLPWIIGGALGLLALAAGGVAVTYWWEESANGKKWAPALAAAEQQYGLPAGLLSRQAYEESGFQSAVIDGTQPSPAGALGILQLEPAYFSSVNVPTPFSDADTQAQIDQAAAEDARLYSVFGSWPLALAAYNWGEGNLQNWLDAGGAFPSTTGWPAQTVNYVSQITGSFPAGALA